jgi:predicted XRE-type DNA-binding protein
MTRNKHIGSNFDDFLAEEGILAESKGAAVKQVIAYQLQQWMQTQQLSKTAMATKMRVSQNTLDRLLNPAASVTLTTLIKAAQAMGKNIEISIS